MSTDTIQVSHGSRLNGKVCVVTGAGSGKGIGWATVVKFANEGARHVYIMDICMNELDAMCVALEAKHLATKVTAVQGDVTDEETVKSICNRAVEEQGRLDVFFANAGGSAGGFQTPFQEMSAEIFMKGLKLNALSCFLAAKHATKAMEKAHPESGKLTSGGSIVFTASISGSSATPGAVEYCASKAAIINMAMNIAYENQLLRNSVRVNAVCPGPIATTMGASILPALKEAQRPFVGLPGYSVIKMGTPEDVANAVAFLASDEAGYVNGQSWAIDCGIANPILLAPILDLK